MSKEMMNPEAAENLEAPKKRKTKRTGSPWKGLGAVLTKEVADHFSSTRMRILEFLIFVIAIGTVYLVFQNLSTSASSDQFLYLKFFTIGQNPLPNFVGLMGIIIPIVAIALGFDAMNGEFNQRTLSRVLAQPIYRDALILGKFLAALITLALVLAAIWILIFGAAMLRLGVPPSAEEVGRAFIFLFAAIAYGGIWLGLSLFFSILFRQPATSLLTSLSFWLLFTVFWSMIAEGLAQTISPVRIGFAEEFISQASWNLTLDRINPNYLYSEITLALLNPSQRFLGFVLPTQLEGAILGTPLPLGQSLLIMWPQLSGIIGATILLFALSYVQFQRQEIRA